VLALVLATVPCLFWLWSVWRHDDHEREPWGFVVLAVVLGGLSPLAVLWARPIIEHWLAPVSPLVDAFVVTALAEELWKALFFLPLLVLPELDEPLDGCVYGAAVGLGFAAFENAFFIGASGNAQLAIQRVFTATLMHAACSGCIGLALACAKLRGLTWLRTGYLGVALAVPVLLHGLYDFYLSGARAHAMISLLLVLPAALALLSVKLRWARRRSSYYHAT
tara:strand:- start:75816 stop:76481 length:666 start_codon:yes stop_codon:yes gene_type:complete